jgi:HlyD family secretion protein
MTMPKSLLLILLSGMCVSCGNPRSAGRYETARVARGTLVQYVTASGTLSALESVDVGSQVSGKITGLYADFNSPVKKGQLVAQIDPTVYQATLRQARADLTSAKADVLLKRQNLDRTKVLAPLRAASQYDLQQATAQLAQAEASVAVKQAALDTAQANLGYCRITAPVDGVVISRKVDAGQTVIAAMSTPVLFTIAKDISAMNISAEVSEADIGQVKIGQSVDFGVDAYPDEVFHGQVTQVRMAATTTQNVVTYEVLIAIRNPSQVLFPGMTANVSIRVAQRDSVLEISNAALRYTPAQGTAFSQAPPATLERHQQLVYALEKAGTLRPILVKTGITDGLHTEVLEGITEGAAIVTATRATPKSSMFPPPPRQTP